jgi:hypothetical protein
MPQWGDLGERLEHVQPNFDVYMLGKLLWCMVSGRLKLPREYHKKPLTMSPCYSRTIRTCRLSTALLKSASSKNLTIIDRLRFDGVKAGDVAQFFEPCRNLNSRISDSPCDLGILQFHHSHSVKVYPKLFITISHTSFSSKFHRAV